MLEFISHHSLLCPLRCLALWLKWSTTLWVAISKWMTFVSKHPVNNRSIRCFYLKLMMENGASWEFVGPTKNMAYGAGQRAQRLLESEMQSKLFKMLFSFTFNRHETPVLTDTAVLTLKIVLAVSLQPSWSQVYKALQVTGQSWRQ